MIELRRKDIEDGCEFISVTRGAIHLTAKQAVATGQKPMHHRRAEVG